MNENPTMVEASQAISDAVFNPMTIPASLIVNDVKVEGYIQAHRTIFPTKEMVVEIKIKFEEEEGVEE